MSNEILREVVVWRAVLLVLVQVRMLIFASQPNAILPFLKLNNGIRVVYALYTRCIHVVYTSRAIPPDEILSHVVSDSALLTNTKRESRRYLLSRKLPVRDETDWVSTETTSARKR